MTCLNLYKAPYLKTYDPNHPRIDINKGSSGIEMRNNDKFDYFYIQFSCHNSFRIYNINDIVPAPIMEKIKHGDVYLVLDNSLEPFLNSADSIYHHIVIAAGVPAKKIIFMSSIPTMIDYVKILAKKLNQDIIKVEWSVLFEYMLQQVTFRNKLPTLQIKQYPKKFLNLNRRWRPHRPLLMVLMQDRTLIDKGHISFGVSDCPGYNWSGIWPMILGIHRLDPEIIEIINRNESIKNLPPLYLDTQDLVTNRADHQDSTNRYYTETYFSVVSETTFHSLDHLNGVPFFSEKIFKAIAYGHPFVLVTYPNSLQYLKKLGYKTFDGLIDERYDLEVNDAKRLIMIVDEIKRLCELSQEELTHFLIEAKKICDHNFEVLRAKKVFIHPMN